MATIAIEIDKDRLRVSLFDISHMENELREIFGRDVGGADRRRAKQQPVPARIDPFVGGAP